jgi:hypothetical protein
MAQSDGHLCMKTAEFAMAALYDSLHDSLHVAMQLVDLEIGSSIET